MDMQLQLNDLPPELLGRIFGYLTAPDILGLKLVCPAAGFPCGPVDPGPLSRSIVLSMMWSQINHVYSISMSSLLQGYWKNRMLLGHPSTDGQACTNIARGSTA